MLSNVPDVGQVGAIAGPSNNWPCSIESRLLGALVFTSVWRAVFFSMSHPQHCADGGHGPAQTAVEAVRLNHTAVHCPASERLGAAVQVIGGLLGWHMRPGNLFQRRELFRIRALSGFDAVMRCGLHFEPSLRLPALLLWFVSVGAQAPYRS